MSKSRLQGKEADQYALIDADVAKRLNATVRMSLDECLAYISDDELLEVTPLSLRLRKAELSALDRKRQRRDGAFAQH